MSRIIKKGKTALASSILNILGLTAAFADFDVQLFDQTLQEQYKKEQNLSKLVTLFTILAIVIMRRYLEGFAYRVPLHIWVFAMSLLAVMAITIAVVTLRSLRAATVNPEKSLRTE